MTYQAELFNDNRPNVGVTVVPFVYKDNKIQVLLYKRASNAEVFSGDWALPNIFFDRQIHNNLDEAVFGALNEKTNIKIPHFEQLGVYAGLYIDPDRITTINVGYIALLREDEVKHISALDPFETRWVAVEDLGDTQLAFNHNEVLNDAYKRLCYKAGYSSSVFHLLPDHFTISELREMLELLLDVKLDNSRFRDRIKKSGVLSEVKGKTKAANHRPAQVYKVNSKYEGDFYPKSLTKPS